MKNLKLISGNFTKEIQVKENTNLLYAVQESGLFIDAPCGGNGVCKKCTVFIDGKSCLACQTSVNKDMIVVLPEYSNLVVEEDKNLFIEKFKDIKFKPVIQKIEIFINPEERTSYQSDLEYFRNLLKKEGFEIFIPADVELLSKISKVTHKKNTYTIYLFEENNKYEIVDILEGTNLKNLGIGIDLGTTTISIALLDLDSGIFIDSITFYNPQTVYGEDIIHRIIYAQKNNGADILQKKVQEELNRSISSLCLKNSLSYNEIKSVILSGNTTMVHLFLGLPVKFIRETPYSPVMQKFPILNTSSFIDVIKNGKLFVIPCVANYLGGDLISGVISCRLHKEDKINILLDIGTNGEIIIGNKDWLISCACSAGPAFEGMGLNCGVRFKQGAITEVSYENYKFIYEIAGNSKPCGISGTGIISLIKHLKEQNFIDNRGKFTERVKDKINQRKAFTLFNENDTINNERIFVDETDIDNILRAKAAIYSGISLLLEKLSIEISEIDNLFIAGGIGNSLNIDNALEIGLFPRMRKEKIVFIGNSSLTGAIRFLLSKVIGDETNDLFSQVTYIDLSNESSYMDEFMAALFIPHTDMN